MEQTKKDNKKAPVKRKQTRKKDTTTAREVKRKKEQFLVAFKSSLGNVSDACNGAGIGRTTFYRWKEKDKEFKQAVSDINEEALDFAETALKKLIQEGNVASIIFYLKTKGKDRGYVEKIETEELGEALPPVQIVLPSNKR